MSNFFASIVDKVHKNLDPSLAQKLDEAKQQVQLIQMQTIAVLVASVAFGTFGVANAVAGGITAFPIILVGLPVGYLAYNAYHVAKNLYDVIDNVKNYRNSYGIDLSLDAQKLKSKLKEGTCCFEWLTNAVVDEMVRSGHAR